MFGTGCLLPKVLGWYFIFMGVSMMSNYLQGQEMWTGPSTYVFVEAPENTKWLRLSQMVEKMSLFRTAVAIMCKYTAFLPISILAV